MILAGADNNVEPQGTDMLPGMIHYYVGNDPAQWRTNVRQFRQIRYHNIYPGVDLVFYGNHTQLEFDFDVSSGADASVIAIKVVGATIKKHGANLELITPSGNVAILKRPDLYQGEGITRHRVSGGYSVRQADEIALAVGRYDHTQALVIDPALIYSTFVQLSNPIQPFAIAVDGSGNAYLTGESSADATHFSAFVLKFDASGSSVLYQTFLGGTQPTNLESPDIGAAGFGIQVDANGNAYLAGMTHQSDFPTTKGAYSTTSICANGATNVGCLEPFAAKLDSNGNLVFSTFLTQPTALDTAGPVPSSIALDSNGALYVTGATAQQGLNTPITVAGLTTTAGAFQTTRNQHNNSSGFVLKLHPDGSTLDYATYLGGNTGETAGGIAVDSDKIAYVVGGTSSPDFPCTNPPATSATSAFFSKLKADGSGQLFSTCLAGPDGQAKGTSIAIDSSKAVYVTGMTITGSFPPPQFGDFSVPAFAAKFDSSGNLLYSQLLGTNMTSGLSLIFGNPPQSFIASDNNGNAYVASGFGGFDNSLIVASKLDTTGSKVYSIPVGPTSSRNSSFGGVALDSQQNFYVTGLAADSNDPASFGDLIPGIGTTIGAFQPLPIGNVFRPFLQKYSQSLGSALGCSLSATGGVLHHLATRNHKHSPNDNAQQLRRRRPYD